MRDPRNSERSAVGTARGTEKTRVVGRSSNVTRPCEGCGVTGATPTSPTTRPDSPTHRRQRDSGMRAQPRATLPPLFDLVQPPARARASSFPRRRPSPARRSGERGREFATTCLRLCAPLPPPRRDRKCNGNARHAIPFAPANRIIAERRTRIEAGDSTVRSTSH